VRINQSYVDCEVVVSRLEHLLDAVDEALELRVGVDVEEVSGGQLGGRHVDDRLHVVHQEAVVQHGQVLAGRDVTYHVGATQVRSTADHHRVVPRLARLHRTHAVTHTSQHRYSATVPATQCTYTQHT